jgi:hypothetical protein
MLAECNRPGIPEGLLTKRWFTDSWFDLFVWIDSTGTVVSFQLCYDKPSDEHALTWKRPATYYHQRVDDGENKPGKSKSTPVLLPDGMFSAPALADRFLKASQRMDPAIARFVHETILDFTKSVAHA